MASPSAAAGAEEEVAGKKMVTCWLQRSCPGRLKEGLQSQRVTGQFCDVTLQMGGREIRGHACVMALFSPYLEDLLVKRSRQLQPSSLPIVVSLGGADEACGECAEKLVAYMYLGAVGVESEHLPHLQSLGKMLGMGDVVDFCQARSKEVEVPKKKGVEQEDAPQRLLAPPPPPPPPSRAKHKKCQSNASKSYMCIACGATHQKVADLLRHLRENQHLGCICSLCGFQSDSEDSLKQHLFMHDHPEPFQCAVCYLRFRTRTALRLHVPKHSTETPWTCPECSRGFKWKHALRNHMLVHSAEKRHLCDQCGFSTSYKSTFREHGLTHSGEVFWCPHPGCKFKAIRKQNLNAHLLTHRKEKPYQCEVCGESFSLAKNMRRHALKHGPGTSFTECPVNNCSFRTTRVDKLKDHLRKSHQDLDTKDSKVKGKSRKKKEGHTNIVIYTKSPNATSVKSGMNVNSALPVKPVEDLCLTIEMTPELMQQMVLMNAAPKSDGT